MVQGSLKEPQVVQVIPEPPSTVCLVIKSLFWYIKFHNFYTVGSCTELAALCVAVVCLFYVLVFCDTKFYFARKVATHPSVLMCGDAAFLKLRATKNAPRTEMNSARCA